jgi:hypothetical protein
VSYSVTELAKLRSAYINSSEVKEKHTACVCACVRARVCLQPQQTGHTNRGYTLFALAGTPHNCVQNWRLGPHRLHTNHSGSSHGNSLASAATLCKWRTTSIALVVCPVQPIVCVCVCVCGCVCGCGCVAASVCGGVGVGVCVCGWVGGGVGVWVGVLVKPLHWMLGKVNSNTPQPPSPTYLLFSTDKNSYGLDSIDNFFTSRPILLK